MRSIRSLLILIAISLAVPTNVSAVIIFENGKDEPIYAEIVGKDGGDVIIRVVAVDGEIHDRRLPSNNIEIIETVSQERLATLAPDKPNDYRNYAEELAEKKRDPDARQTAIRLYLIAAHLEPDNLGRSSLLGLTGLARTAAEERKFRAMVYLLDSEHDRRVLKPVNQKTQRTNKPAVQRADELLAGLRFLRNGKKREAVNTSRRLNFQKQLAAFAHVLTPEEFAEACTSKCTECERGKVDCKTCKGAGRVDLRGRMVVCPLCRANGKVGCSTCYGSGKISGVSDETLKKILTIELAISGSAAVNTAGRETETLDEPSKSWTTIVASRNLNPVPTLSLVSITDYDPRKCCFRDGDWVEP